MPQQAAHTRGELLSLVSAFLRPPLLKPVMELSKALLPALDGGGADPLAARVWLTAGGGGAALGGGGGTAKRKREKQSKIRIMQMGIVEHVFFNYGMCF